MAIINYAAREMTAKIVYYGPGLSGKTTSIQYIHEKIAPANKGKLVSLATETDRTLFFDFFPVDFGQIGGFKVKFNFYTVPGQVFYNTTRKLVLKGADGVVFVGDSQQGMREQNLESLENLRENLKIHGLDPDSVPFAIQYNKRDLPNIMPVEAMKPDLNPRNVPEFETSATTGLGIMETMKVICKLVLEDLREKQKASSGGMNAPRPTAPTQPAAPAIDMSPLTQPAEPTPPQPVAPAAPATQAPAPAEMVSGGAPDAVVERSTTIPVHGSGTINTAVAVPLTLNVGEGVEGVSLNVKVEVAYQTKERGTIAVGEPTKTEGKPEAASAPKKKGLMGRLFGGG